MVLGVSTLHDRFKDREKEVELFDADENSNNESQENVLKDCGCKNNEVHNLSTYERLMLREVREMKNSINIIKVIVLITFAISIFAGIYCGITAVNTQHKVSKYYSDVLK